MAKNNGSEIKEDLSYKNEQASSQTCSLRKPKFMCYNLKSVVISGCKIRDSNS